MTIDYETMTHKNQQNLADFKESSSLDKREEQKMSTEPKELPSWDNLMTEQKDAVELHDMEEHILLFEVDSPREGESKKFKGKKMMFFDVQEQGTPKTLIVSSIRLAVKLKQHIPLKGKTLSIRRTGQRTDIDYIVEEKGAVTSEESVN